LYAFEGYAALLLADLYCSGVPLSTLDFDGDFTYKPSSTTDEIYTHAITLFDSALAVSTDSASIQTLARVGKGRALLALGRYQDAKDAVTDVADADVYRIRVLFRTAPSVDENLFGKIATVSDREGVNGLPFLSSRDPRTASDTTRYVNMSTNIVINFPNKYLFRDSTWFVLASGIEAHLIRAEAALHAGTSNDWLTIFNALRTTGTFSRVDTSATGTVDTLWNAGIGGIRGLRPLQDPGPLDARITLLFDERAMWLFASGHRQGDLRRLVRVYGRDRESVYPTGQYQYGTSVTGYYGGDINLPIPQEEMRNPYFRGCLND